VAFLARQFGRDQALGRGSTGDGARATVVGPASIIQSDFRSSAHGNFEVVVPIVGTLGQVELHHYWHDNSDVSLPWRRGQLINDPAHDVLGAACLIQSDFKSGKHGNFEVVAWVRLPSGQIVLQHYWHDNSDVNLPWRSGQVIIAGAKGPGVVIQSSFRSGDHGNFEVVVPVDGRGGRTYLRHVWHDNSDVNLPWSLGQIITEVVSTGGTGCLIESDYRSADHGNFELLVDECRSLSGYWHANWDVSLPWLRNAWVIGELPWREIRDTVRICQLTGEFDRTGWNGTGQPPIAFNKTESQFGIRGTDLGASFRASGTHLFRVR
jgi:hypothetical protein